MKKIVKASFVILLCAALTLTLTSCFTSPSEYTEWELSDNENKISDGNTVYTAYQNGEFLESWSLGYNGAYVYVNTAESEIGDSYANIYSALADRGILAAKIYKEYSDTYVGCSLYVSGTGKATLDSIGMPTLDTECYARDGKTNMQGKITDEMISLVNGLKAREATVQRHYAELISLDKIEICDEALDGFFRSVLGGFYFDRTDVLYVDGELDAKEIYLDAVVLTEAERTLLSGFINGEITDFRKINNEYEKPLSDTSIDERFTAVARTVLICTVFALGIFMPLIPIVLSLFLLKQRAWRFKATDYILLISSGVWLLSGITVFVILLF